MSTRVEERERTKYTRRVAIMACSGSGSGGNSKSALENLFAACVDLDRKEEGREER